MARLQEVFGIFASVPTYTYVDRQGLDGEFQHPLQSDRHVVIYGGSKQGKTSLRRKQLPESQSIIVPCKPETSLSEIYDEIRRQLSTSVVFSQTTSSSNKGQIELSAGGSVNLPFMGGIKGDTSGTGSYERDLGKTKVPAGDPRSLVALARDIVNQQKRIVIEDFHYLSEEQRKSFAFDLKAFWNARVFFLIIGVWAEQNLLTLYNNDLSGRVEEIDIQWINDDLRNVLQKGQTALNIKLSANIERALIQDAR